MNQAKNNSSFKLIPKDEDNKPIVQQKKKTSSGKIKISGINTKVQQEIETIGVYDHEWNALHDTIRQIKKQMSTSPIASLIDGAALGLLIPGVISFVKIVLSKGLATNAEMIECLIYFIILIVYIIFALYRYVKKPTLFNTYTDFESEINHLDSRMCEIENRLGIKKEE